VTTLADQVRAALDETERIARDACQENWRWYAEDKTVITHRDEDGEWDAYRPTGTRADAYHIAHNDPASALRMVAAHRKILDLHGPDDQRNRRGTFDQRRCVACLTDRYGYSDDWEPDPWPCPTVLALAEAYGVEA
jgi:hypothetical protein